MLYTIIGVIIINLYLLSLHAPMPKKNKFTDYLAFKQTLYKALFQHSTNTAAAGTAKLLSVVGPMNLVLPPGDTVPVVNNPDTKNRAELAAVAAIAYITGKILVTATANLFIKYQSLNKACFIYNIQIDY